MTVIVAYKKDDTIYMGADSQCTTGSGKQNYIAGISKKIHLINDDTLLACTGQVRNLQVVQAHPEWFAFDKKEGLTKEFLVTETCPKIYDAIKEMGGFQNKPGERLDVGFSCLVVSGTKMFEICTNLLVLEYRDWQAIGGGDVFSLYSLSKINRDGDIEKQLVDAMKVTAKYYTGASGPYLLVNSKDKEFKVRED